MGTQSWIDAGTVIAAFAFTATAVIALAVAMRNERRSRQALLVQTYLQLRSGFLEIYRELGALDDVNADTAEVRLTRQAYWHYAWDEWYVAKRMAPEEFSNLWDEFFAFAVRSGYAHPALRATLDELAANKEVGFGAYAGDLISELRRMDGGPTES